MAATMPLATSGKQQLIRWLSGETCAAARAMREVSTAWNTAVALNPPSATRRVQALPPPEITEAVCSDAACTMTAGAAARQQLGGAAVGGEIDLVRVDRDRAREHVGAGLCRRSDPGEAKGVAPRDRNPRRLRRGGCEIAGDALREAAGSENQDVARLRHVLSFAVAALSACRSDPIPDSASAQYRSWGHMTSTTVDVAIIGGGLMGCFSAYFLRQRGRSVAVIEKDKVCAAASAVNFGNLRLQGRNPEEFPLSLRAHAIWEDLARLTGEDCGVVSCGHVYLGFAPSDQPKLEQAARDARAAGLDVDLLDGPSARRCWPLLSEVVTGASWSKRDAVADPALASPAVARLALRAGAQILEHTKVVAVEPTAIRLRHADRPGDIP